MPETESRRRHEAIEDHRSRLLGAMATLVATRPYVEISVTDVVKEAGVSKRTFYEHFMNKDTCFVALFEVLAMSALGTLKRALSPERPWQAQVEQALASYLGHLSDGHYLLRAFFVDVYHIGDQGLVLRRSAMDQLVALMLETVNSSLASNGSDQRLSRERAVAAVGAIQELVLLAIEEGRGHRLRELTPVCTHAVLALAGDLGALERP